MNLSLNNEGGIAGQFDLIHYCKKKIKNVHAALKL